jgi:hypothetical protein
MENKTPFQQDMEILTELCRKISGLTTDPQPGLMSWGDLLSSNLKEMKATLERIGV